MRTRLLVSSVLGIIAASVLASQAGAVTVGNLAASIHRTPLSSCIVPIQLSWTLPSPGPAGGISAIRIYRDGLLSASLGATATSYYTWQGLENFFPGDVVQYQVALVNGSGVEEPNRASIASGLPACDPAPAQMRVLVMLFDFSDEPADPAPDRDQIHYALFEDPLSPASFLANSSYFQTTMSGDVTPVIRMPQPYSSYRCLCAEELEEALQTAALVTPNIGDYDRYVFYFTRAPQTGAISITANTVQGTVYAVGMMGGILPDWTFSPWYVVTHEFGHDLGMWHASMWKCPNGKIVGPSLTNLTQGNCFVAAYDDNFDPMGMIDGPRVRDYGAFHKLVAGHFGLDQVATLELSQLTYMGTEIWVDRLERDSPGTKLLRIHLGNGFYYLVENRHQGPSAFFEEDDKVIVRLLPTKLSVNSDTLALRRDGVQLFLRPDTPAFVDPHRRVGISVVETRSQNGVHQAKVAVYRTPESCGILGVEVLPLLLLGARARRRARQSRDAAVVSSEVR